MTTVTALHSWNFLHHFPAAFAVRGLGGSSAWSSKGEHVMTFAYHFPACNMSIRVHRPAGCLGLRLLWLLWDVMVFKWFLDTRWATGGIRWHSRYLQWWRQMSTSDQHLHLINTSVWDAEEEEDTADVPWVCLRRLKSCPLHKRTTINQNSMCTFHWKGGRGVPIIISQLRPASKRALYHPAAASAEPCVSLVLPVNTNNASRPLTAWVHSRLRHGPPGQKVVHLTTQSVLFYSKKLRSWK